MAMVIVGCPYEADVAVVAVDIVLWTNEIGDLSEGKIFKDVA